MSELINNREHQIRVLKDVITKLHRGAEPDSVKAELRQLVHSVDGSEIAAMEQQLMAEGMAVEEIQSMCDLHSQVLGELVVGAEGPPVSAGHPIDTFRRENAALLEVTARMRRELAGLDDRPDGVESSRLLFALRSAAGELQDVDKHYQRKENLLFPMLERHGVTGPSKVMWGKDDEVRELLRDLDQALATDDMDGTTLALVAGTVAEAALAAVEEMIRKEERVLLPMSSDTLTEEEWGAIWAQSPEYGWCLVEPRQGYAPPASVADRLAAEVPQDGAVTFATGRLSAEQVKGLLSSLPVDVTFVDADDRVRYFSHGPNRIFARSKAVLGRKVQHCHPPKSVHLVEQILSDFRDGRQSVAEFWIQLHGKLVHIRYFAVRDDDGAYLGTLEVTQDLTPLRALEGERRILQYERAKPEVKV